MILRSPGAQFIELYNNSTNTTFDLSGWQLPGSDYTFPNGAIIAPANIWSWRRMARPSPEAYGATNPVFDIFSGTLRRMEFWH